MISGYSLVENVFGASFVVYDAMGVMLTTAKNVKLFRHAQALLENLSLYDAQGLAHALAQLREEADLLEQVDYDCKVWREWQCIMTTAGDFSVLADSA